MFTQSGTCNRPKAINDANHYLITINTKILRIKKEKWMSSAIITQLLVVLRVMKYHFVMFNTTECLKKKKIITCQQSSVGVVPVVPLFQCSATFQLCVQRYYR